MADVKALSLAEQDYLQRQLEKDAESRRKEREEAVERVRGKYRHLGTSSEAFIASKQEEIDIEDRRTRSK